MQSDTLLHVANFSTLFICMVLKFPQIFVLMRAETTAGVSLNSLLLELIGFVISFVGGEKTEICLVVYFPRCAGIVPLAAIIHIRFVLVTKQLKPSSDLMLLDLLKINACPS